MLKHCKKSLATAETFVSQCPFALRPAGRLYYNLGPAYGKHWPPKML